MDGTVKTAKVVDWRQQGNAKVVDWRHQGGMQDDHVDDWSQKQAWTWELEQDGAAISACEAVNPVVKQPVGEQAAEARSDTFEAAQASSDPSNQVTYRTMQPACPAEARPWGSPARYATVSEHANPSVLAAKGGSQRQSGTREWIFKKRRWREQAAFQATHSIRTVRNQTMESLKRKFGTHQCRMGGSMWDLFTNRHCSINI